MQGIFWCDAVPHHCQPFGSKIEVRERLGGNNAHARFPPGNRSAHSEVARLYGYAELTGTGIASNDGICGD